jgi:hypothetical protein
VPLGGEEKGGSLSPGSPSAAPAVAAYCPPDRSEVYPPILERFRPVQALEGAKELFA